MLLVGGLRYVYLFYMFLLHFSEIAQNTCNFKNCYVVINILFTNFDCHAFEEDLIQELSCRWKSVNYLSV